MNTDLFFLDLLTSEVLFIFSPYRNIASLVLVRTQVRGEERSGNASFRASSDSAAFLNMELRTRQYDQINSGKDSSFKFFNYKPKLNFDENKDNFENLVCKVVYCLLDYHDSHHNFHFFFFLNYFFEVLIYLYILLGQKIKCPTIPSLTLTTTIFIYPKRSLTRTQYQVIES